MRVEIRSDSVLIEGYVNAVARDSRPMVDKTTGRRFVEQIVPGAFARALQSGPVPMLLNHDKNRVLADGTAGTLELQEDSIGLRARAEVTDAEVIEKARAHKLRGWSFGFYELDAREEDTMSGMMRRYINDLQLEEVSLIDDTMTPCYAGTSVETRAEKAEVLMAETLETRAQYIERTEPDPLAEYKQRLNALRKDDV